MGIRLAVVGASGAVGTLVRELLEAREFPCDDVRFLASPRSAGQELEFRGARHRIVAMEPDAFRDVDLVIGSTPDDVARQFVPWAVERGAVVVDESAAHRMDPNVPLVIPEVNPQAIDRHRGVIASPNCSTTQMAVALWPLHRAARLKRVVVATYQATSGAGVAGQQELIEQSRAALEHAPQQPQTFQHPIAFNLIPQIGSPKEQGYTSEEWKMVQETYRIFEDDSFAICPTCVRVPVTNCHSESIYVELHEPLDVEQAIEIWQASPGISVMDDVERGIYPMPINGDGRDDVLIGRIRQEPGNPRGIAFWCVSDNLRKGAATNAVQIAELLVGRISKCDT